MTEAAKEQIIKRIKEILRPVYNEADVNIEVFIDKETNEMKVSGLITPRPTLLNFEFEINENE